MEVFVANEQDLPIPEARLSALARHALNFLEVDEDAELSVLFVSPPHIRLLNQRFAGEDHATDVLAFPIMEDEEEGGLLLGDVVVCPEVASANATSQQHSYERELEVLLVHGTLHLLGYDHQGETDKSKMDDCLDRVIESFSSVQ
jgi:probable rRNA maturation factor